MPAATYNIPWVSYIDEIRALAQDNLTDGVTTDVIDPILVDDEITSPVAAQGYQQGAITVFAMYASAYGLKVIQATEGPETFRWSQREKLMQDIGAKIASGLILIGNALAPQIQAGPMTTGQPAADYFRQTGIWPRTTDVSFQ